MPEPDAAVAPGARDVTGPRRRRRARRPAGAGLEVDEALGGLGIVTGRAAPDAVERLRGLPGVTVEPEVEVQLPPPDAPVQ